MCEYEGCDASFRHRIGLARHKVIHKREKPFTCTVCQKSFQFKTCLVSHMTLHTGISKHVCDLCGKMFTVSTSLRRHQEQCRLAHQLETTPSQGVTLQVANMDLLTDSPDTIFMCGVCGKKFSSFHLIEHHTNSNCQDLNAGEQNVNTFIKDVRDNNFVHDIVENNFVQDVLM